MANIILKLNKPIQAHGNEITEIELREPTGKDVQDIGFPYLVTTSEDEQAVQIQVKVVCKYVIRLASIPASSVEQLSAADISSLAGVVLSFFGVQAIE